MAVKFVVSRSFNKNEMEKFSTAWYYLRYVIYTFLLFQSFSVSAAINANVELRVDGTGFHRNVIYHVKLNNFTEEDCQVALYLELPSSLYVNIDELADLRRIKETKACSTGETDIESFMENSQSQNVTLCTRLNSGSCVMSLPIHQRYWYPKEGGTYENILLKRPHLLIGCKRRIKEYRVSKLDLCPLCATLSVKWREIPYDIANMDYVWTIPVGNLSFLPYVTSITLLTTFIGTIFLIRIIWKTSSKTSEKDD